MLSADSNYARVVRPHDKQDISPVYEARRHIGTHEKISSYPLFRLTVRIGEYELPGQPIAVFYPAISLAERIGVQRHERFIVLGKRAPQVIQMFTSCSSRDGSKLIMNEVDGLN